MHTAKSTRHRQYSQLLPQNAVDSFDFLPSSSEVMLGYEIIIGLVNAMHTYKIKLAYFSKSTKRKAQIFLFEAVLRERKRERGYILREMFRERIKNILAQESRRIREPIVT